MAEKVLIIEDEASLLRIVASYFKKAGFEPLTASDGEAGLYLFNQEIACVIVDITMPKMDGWEVVRHIREISDVPIVVMTALTSEENALKGYELKVDDYVPKPFSPVVLVAKVKNLIERYQGKLTTHPNQLKVGDLTIDELTREVKNNDQLIHLSKTEFDLLVYLIKNQNIVLSRSQFLDAV